MLERLERTRDGERFDELVDDLLPGGEVARVTAAELLDRLPSRGYRHVAVISRCRECGVREAIPQIREASEKPDRNSRDTRQPGLRTRSPPRPEERIAFLIDALGRRGFVVAETAAIFIGGSEDPCVVEPLLLWLENRLLRARSKTQAHCTAEVIAACVRLGDSEQSARLCAILGGVRLTELEQRAANGRWPGLILSGRFPVADWPG